MRIAMTGSGYMAALVAKALLNTEHEMVAIIDNGRTMKGFKRWLLPAIAGVLGRKTSALGMAKARKIPIVFIDKMTDDELAPLRAAKPDLILVAGFSIILKKSIIAVPRIGCVNCHSSLLPKHRGPNPFQAVILAGDAETGITYHVIDEGIDTGPILAQYRIPVTQSDTAGTIHRRTSELAAEKLPELLNQIERDGLNGAVQKNEEATYDKKLAPEELFIRWDRPAHEIEALVRSCFPFSIARCKYNGKTVFVTRAKAYESDTTKPAGEIIAVKPFVRVSTGKGVLALMLGYTTGLPMPWLWPGLVWRPPIGAKLE